MFRIIEIIFNQDCFYCNSADHRRARPVQKDYSEYITLLDKLAAWRAHTPNSYGTLHSITYPGGGEPTLLPYYERVLEHTIDLGFLTSITTNGSRLDKLIDNVNSEKIKKMSWIGIDIDAGSEQLYEKIRRSKTKTSPFNHVLENAKNLVQLGANVDFKVLLNEHNENIQALKDIFQVTAQTGVRLLYIRPAIINGRAHEYQPNTLTLLEKLAAEYGVDLKLNQTKTLPRNYNRCHQMFQFPVFCADGHIYVCCDNKGNPEFSIGKWDQEDFRELWLKDQHWSVYNKVNTHLCPPCRPNVNNIAIQNVLNDNKLLEVLNT